MFCPRCGAENPNEYQICRNCGLPLTQAAFVVPQPVAKSYAGFWKRFAAYFLDGIVLNIVVTIVSFAAGAGNYYINLNGEEFSGRAVAVAIISAVLGWLYFTLMESSKTQGTLGKMALSIVVTDLDGKRISFGKANARFWSKIVSAIILCIGFIMAGFTEKKQALHDTIAGTLVVNKWSS
jgi:uncharacterized RDD family membrane protein YckC